MVSSPELAPMHMSPYNEEPARHLYDPNAPNSRDNNTYRQRKGGGSYSYGPGISQHGDTVGPRLNYARKASNRSVNGDEESIAVSSRLLLNPYR
jgi:hypothetical protein